MMNMEMNGGSIIEFGDGYDVFIRYASEQDFTKFSLGR